jgi:hypothetical protein
LPEFRTLTKDEIEGLARRSILQDLTDYLAFLEQLRPGDWGSVTLKPGETQRSVKRRTTTAAGSQGKKIMWRARRDDSPLVFQVAEAKPARRSRAAK